MSAQFSEILWLELRMPAKWGILECRHMWHSKFQSWVRKPQYFPIFEAKTCRKQFIDWREIYPKAFQVPSSTPSCMIRIAWGNHVYPSEGFYQNLEYIVTDWNLELRFGIYIRPLRNDTAAKISPQKTILYPIDFHTRVRMWQHTVRSLSFLSTVM